MDAALARFLARELALLDGPGYVPFVPPARSPGPHVGPTCPACRTIHGSDAAVAVGRFNPEGPRGYRARDGGPLRLTRAAAVADTCARRSS
jgi:hypothetical protein